MIVPVYNLSGEAISNIELRDDIFAIPSATSVIHQALLAQQSNRRLGTVKVKTRAEVAGSTRKLYMQKHTGRARQGMIRAPHRRGGGKAFGPRPRSFQQALPQKMRVLALKSILSDKVAQGEIMVLDELKIDNPRTKDMLSLLKTFKAESNALVVPEKIETNLIKAIRNIPGVKALSPFRLNVVDLLSYKKLLMSRGALNAIHNLWGSSPAKAVTAES